MSIYYVVSYHASSVTWGILTAHTIKSSWSWLTSTSIPLNSERVWVIVTRTFSSGRTYHLSFYFARRPSRLRHHSQPSPHSFHSPFPISLAVPRSLPMPADTQGTLVTLKHLLILWWAARIFHHASIPKHQPSSEWGGVGICLFPFRWRVSHEFCIK